MWDTNAPAIVLVDDIIRRDSCGMDLMEIRLKSGFVNIPVPFIYALSVKDINAITKSDEMIPWMLYNEYDRPIARRIAETSGVKRDSFGVRKKAIVDFYLLPKNRSIRRSFLNHIKIDPISLFLHIHLNKIPYLTKKIFGHLGIKFIDYRKKYFLKNIDLPFNLWLWSNYIIANKLRILFLKNNIEVLKKQN